MWAHAPPGKVFKLGALRSNLAVFQTKSYDIIFLYICFTNVANEEAAQVANINQLPGTDGFTSPLKQALHHKNSISIYQVSL